MSRSRVFSLPLLLVLAALAQTALAQTAGMMSFQALIKDGAGLPLDGPQDLLFEIIDAAVPTPNVLASFTQLGVPAKQGVVSTKYGPVSPGLFDGGASRRLRVTVTSQNPDLVMSPIEIVTPPAIAEQLNALGTGTPALVTTASGRVGIGTNAPGGLLELADATPYVSARVTRTGTGTTQLGVSSTSAFLQAMNSLPLTLWNSTGEVMRIADNGNVGIGTASPSYRLSVVGSESDMRMQLRNAGGGHDWQMISTGTGSGVAAGSLRFYDSGFGDRMVIGPNGNVGIGTTSPGNRLTIAESYSGPFGAGTQLLIQGTGGNAGQQLQVGYNHSGNYGTIQAREAGVAYRTLSLNPEGGFVGIGTASPDRALVVNGSICATGTIGGCSDIRYKKNIRTMSTGLETVAALRPVRFEWRQDEFSDHDFENAPQIGFIAQEMLGIVPEIVQCGSDGYYSVDYGRLTPLLTRAVQELNQNQRTESAALRAENETLKSRVEELETRLSRLEALLQKPIAGDKP